MALVSYVYMLLISVYSTKPLNPFCSGVKNWITWSIDRMHCRRKVRCFTRQRKRYRVLQPLPNTCLRLCSAAKLLLPYHVINAHLPCPRRHTPRSIPPRPSLTSLYLRLMHLSYTHHGLDLHELASRILEFRT